MNRSLRQPMATTNAINMPPRWGFEIVLGTPGYKHAAPLGLLADGDATCYKHAAPLGL